VTVSGGGSTWTSSNWLYVGYHGDGTLEIINGGTVVANGHSFIGNRSTGTVTVSGAGSTWASAGSLYVGSRGGGTLYITNGGSVSNDSSGSIGHYSGSTGAVTVSGAGSTWTNSKRLYVGRNGGATLDITNGGIFSNDSSGSIGYYSGSTGAVTVSGADSTWTNSDRLYVGYNGDGTLNIYDGGLVSVADVLTIDHNGGGDSFITMATGGMLALSGDADDSLGEFLGLIGGTDAIRYWDESAWGWADITGATAGVDYTLNYLAEGELAGYTVLTVSTPIPTPGDTNRDYIVDGSDYDNLLAQFGGPPGVESADFTGDGLVDLGDFAILRGHFDSGAAAAPDGEFAAMTPEPASAVLLLLGLGVFVHRKKAKCS